MSTEISPFPAKTVIGLAETITSWSSYIYKDHGGVFFLFDDRVSYHVRYASKCRESISWTQTNKEMGIGIGMMCHKVDPAKVAKVFSEVEDMLKLEKKSELFLTQSESAILLMVNPWWFETRVRREVLTLIMRAAVCFYVDDMDKAFDAYPLTHRCMNALKHFLKGNTEFIPSDMKGGFADFFWNLSDSAVATYLVAPKKEEPKKS